MYTNVHIYIYIYIYTTIVIYTHTIIYTVYTYDYISHYTTKFFVGSLCNTVATPKSMSNKSISTVLHPSRCALFTQMSQATPNAQPKFLNAQQHLQCPMFHRPIRSVIHHKSWISIHAMIQHQKQRSNNCHRLIKKTDLGMGQNPGYLVNSKIAGKWMFIPLKWYL